MKTLSVFLILVLLPLSSMAASPLGFKDWKYIKVTQAHTRLKEAERLAIKKKLGNAKFVSQARLSYQLAQDLTVNDYFVLYLSRYEDKNEIVKAVKKLSPEDVTALLINYQKQLQKLNENALLRNPFSRENRNIHSPSSLE